MCDSLAQYHVHADGETNTASLISTLAEHGLALFDGAPKPADLLQIAHSIATVVPHRDSDHSGLTTIFDRSEERVRSGFTGFSAAALKPHTDRSGVDNPPTLLMMTCGQPASGGGECTLIDGKAVYDDLAESEPDALRALSTPRSVYFGGAAGHLGSIFTKTRNGRVVVRLRLDDLAQFSPEITRWLPVLRAAINRHTNTFGLGTGQGYILDNHRWLHGRRAFTGRRTMYRVTGNPFPHLGITPGFRPAHGLGS